MEQEKTVDEKAWLRLYNAAIAFRDLRPWEWMYDSDLFGVKDPISGEIGFCCVMGNLREVFALAVYPGKTGLKSYLRLANCNESPEDTDIPLEQNCLMASFEDREYLSAEDREILKRLKLKYEGKNAWPMFRKYSPGRVPWFLNSVEIESLTVALEQAVEVCPRFKTDRAFIEKIPRNVYSVRVPQKDKQKITWQDKLVAVEEEQTHHDIFIDDDRLKQAREKRLPRKGIWEIDLFYSPSIITDQTPHYYPRLFLCCDQSSGIIFDFQLFGPEGHYEKFADHFLKFIDSVKYLPVEVQVKKEEICSLLYPLLSALNVGIRRVDDLPSLREAKKGLSQYLKKPKIGRNDPCPCGSGKKYKKCCLGKKMNSW